MGSLLGCTLLRHSQGGGGAKGQGWAEGGGRSCPSTGAESALQGGPTGAGDPACVSVRPACDAACPRSLLVRVGKFQRETERASTAKPPEAGMKPSVLEGWSEQALRQLLVRLRAGVEPRPPR